MKKMLLPAVAVLVGLGVPCTATPKTKAEVLADDQQAALLALFIDNELESKEVIAIVKRALDDGLSVNAVNQYGQTLLGQAVENGKIEGVRFLLSRGANPNLANKGGNPPLFEALNYTWNDGRKVQLLRTLLEKGADPNARNHNGDTALTLCAGLGYADCAKALLEWKADGKLKNGRGESPLMIAQSPAKPVFVSLPLQAMLPRKKGWAPGQTEYQPTQAEMNKAMKDGLALQKKMEHEMESRITRGRGRIRQMLVEKGAKE